MLIKIYSPVITNDHTFPPCWCLVSVQAEAPSKLLFFLRAARVVTARARGCSSQRGGIRGQGWSVHQDEEPCCCNSKLEEP